MGRGAVVRALAGAFLFSGVAACGPREVTRLVDGAPITHHAINVHAYASYARGAAAESLGVLEVALSEYEDAASADPSGVEPLVREGAVACALGRFVLADEAFAKAEARDATYEPLWTERSGCATARSDPAAALRFSERGEELDPDSDDAVRAHARALEATGDAARALREIAALAIRHPSPATFTLERDVAARAGDEALESAAERALGGTKMLSSSLGDPRAAADRKRSEMVSGSDGKPSELDRRIAHGDIEAAEALGRRAGMSPSTIAVRAAALGYGDVARRIADPIALADPGDADALIAAIAARAPDDALKFLERVGAHGLRSPSPLGTLLLAELLRARVGPDADVAVDAAGKGDAAPPVHFAGPAASPPSAPEK